MKKRETAGEVPRAAPLCMAWPFFVFTSLECVTKTRPNPCERTSDGRIKKTVLPYLHEIPIGYFVLTTAAHIRMAARPEDAAASVARLVRHGRNDRAGRFPTIKNTEERP